MKARVKATGLVSEVCPYSTIYLEGVDNCFYPDEVEIVDTISDSPDYWTRLEHQYAGMAMYGMLANANHYLWERKQNSKSLAANAAELAHALVEKLKEKEERK